MDVANTNTKQNSKGSDILGYEIIALSTIQSLAWKSANHPDNDGVIVSKLVHSLTGALETTIDNTGTELEFSIDLNDPQLTDIEEMQPILAKLKKGIRLTEDEIARVAMRVTMTIGGKTVYAHIHRLDYVDDHIKEDDQKVARELIMRDRTKIYRNFLAGQKTKSKILNMTGGHLVTERGVRNNPAEFETNSRTNGVPKIFFAANTSYIDESNQKAFVKEQYIADPELNGAIFMSLPMLNGNNFPLRLYVSDISKATASLIYAIYGEALVAHNGNISKAMSIESFNTIKDRVDNLEDNPMLKDFISLVESIMPSENVGPTYKQMLDLLMFQGAKTKTKASPTIVVGKGKLRIGNLEITRDNYRANRDQVIDWIIKNKRHHVSKSYVNAKIKDSAYNNWLFKHGIVFTDAVTTDNGTSFIQPTVRYAPLKSETPTAEKESVKSNQVEFTSDELADPQDVVKKETYIFTDIDADNAKITYVIRTSKDGSRKMEVWDKTKEAGKELISQENFGKDVALTNEEIFSRGFKEEGLPFTIELIETIEGFENIYSKKIVENRKKKRRAEREALGKKESPKPIQPKPARKNIGKLTGGFQSGISVEDAASLGIPLDVLGIETKEAKSFDIDGDLGFPDKKKKSNITKAQEDQNCK